MLSDPLWNGEQFITRRRIEAAQARFWFRAGLGLWLLSTVCVLVVSLNQIQTKHFMTWLIASGTALLPIKSIGWQGERYAPVVLRDWFTANIYHAPLSTWLLWSALVGLIPVAIVGVLVWRHLRRKEPKETHIRGAQVLSVADLSKRLKKAGPGGLQIGSVWMPRDLERLHISVCGGTGSGKSVTLRTLLRQIALRGEPCIVVDSKGAFVREFYSPARGDWLLNATDARCPEWNPWRECDGPVDMMAQAASLFPVLPGMHATTAYYHGEAAKAFHALLEHHPGRDPREIPGVLDGFLKKGLANRAGILQTLERGCQSFRYLAEGTRLWSAKEWVKNPEGWCFLTFRETEKAALLPIVSLWLESLTRQILTRPLNPDQTIWVIIDEVASLQAQPTLLEFMARGREYGGACVVGFQTVLQLYDLYGKNGTEAMLSQAATKLYLSTQNSETQEWISRNIGEQEVLRKNEGETVGSEHMRDSIHRNNIQRVEAALLASQLGALPPLHGYLTVGHYGTAEVEVPAAYMVEREPGFVPRDEAVVEREEIRPAYPRPQGVRRVSTERRAL